VARVSEGAPTSTVNGTEATPAAVDAPSEPEGAPTLDGPAIGGPMRPRRFAVALTVITVVGLGVRVGYVLMVTIKENSRVYDALWYGVTANGLAQGQFFREPFGTVPTAAHPPLTSLILGVVTIPFGVHPGSGLQRLTMAVLGTGVVLCVGLLGRAVAGPWVGLTAAGLAALAPNLWIPNGILMSETPAMLLMALILLGVVRLLRSPTWASAALLGAACGAEALVRAELILFVPTLLVPAALAARQVALRRRFGLAAVGVLAALVVLAPWVGRNLAAFKDPTYISTGDGLALLGANCPAAYSGPGLGEWHLACVASPNANDESVKSSLDQHAAIQFAEHHAGRLPVVVLARIGRLWDFFEPAQMINIDVNEGRPKPAARAGLVVYYALLPFALAGVVILRRRGLRQWFLLVPAGVLTVVAGLYYGTVRFRAPFEVCLVVLAAPALVLVARWLGRAVFRIGSTGRHVTGANATGP
jgi:4-amino-4-deoxy-L-arabinose transferase-like glycosyltransferase